jgi:hypothetical protein
MSSLDVDSLFAVPLGGFVEERRRVARALKAEGRRDEAKRVEKLARPTVPAWVVNQLARQQAPLVKHLVEATDRLRAAQDGTLAGREDGGRGYAQALAAHREALKALRVAAERILRAAGHADNPHLTERVMRNLRSGIAGEQTRALVEAGRLSRDLEEQDLSELIGRAAPASGDAREAPVPPPPARAAQARAPAHARHDAAETGARRRAEEARARAEESARRAADKEQQARARARAQARAAASHEVARLRAEAESARRAADKEQRACAAAREALAAQEARADAARVEADKRAQELAAAEQALRTLTEG